MLSSSEAVLNCDEIQLQPLTADDDQDASAARNSDVEVLSPHRQKDDECRPLGGIFTPFLLFRYQNRHFKYPKI